MSKRKATQPVVTKSKKIDAPARTITNMGPVRKLLDERVLDQSTSTYRLSYTMSATLHKGEENAATTLWMLCGPSGTGKSMSAGVIRHIMGMETGYEYEEHYIEINTTRKKDDTRELCDASSSFSEPMNKKCYEMIEGLNNAIKTPSPYIMLFIHGFDEACYELKLMISSLVRSDECETPNGAIQFVRPSKTALMIVCSSHYGSLKIAEMKMKNDDTAKAHILQDMKCSLPPALIGHIHLTVPFYPLSTETMRILLGIRLDNYIQNSRLVKLYGADQLSSQPNVKEMLINHVLQKIDIGQGMHSRVLDLEEKLNSLIEAAISVVESMQNSRHRRTKEMIYLEKFSFDTQRFDEMLTAELDRVTRGFLSSIQTNPDNQLFLANRDPGRSGTVDTLTMRYGEEVPLCGLIMNINYITVNNYFTDEEVVKKNDDLKTRNKKLKGCLKHITVAAAKGHSKTINKIIKKNQELINESSDDSGEEKSFPLLKRKAPKDDDYSYSSNKKKPRVEEVFDDDDDEEEDTIEDIEELTYNSDETVSSLEDPHFMDLLASEEETLLISSSSTSSSSKAPSRRGRPPRVAIEGFTRLASKNKCYEWQCDKCSQKYCKAEYAIKHQCKKTMEELLPLSIVIDI